MEVGDAAPACSPPGDALGIEPVHQLIETVSWKGQMGAVVGSEGARMGSLSPSDSAMLQAAVAGAGLGVAFNAPLVGALFTFEELTKAFRLRLVVATLIAP